MRGEKRHLELNEKYMQIRNIAIIAHLSSKDYLLRGANQYYSF